jgi:PPOX class probable F420-dependent enzyme
VPGFSQDERDLFHGKNFGHFATIGRDGAPHSTPVWIDERDGDVLVNTAAGRAKERNVRRDSRVAISIHDAEDPYRWIEVRGRVAEFIDGDEAERHIDELSRRYHDGEPWAPRKGQKRVILRIRAEHVTRGLAR